MIHGRAEPRGGYKPGAKGVLVISGGGPDVEVRWPVNTAQFSPDGKRIVTAADDGTARIWDIAPSAENQPAWLPQLAEAISGLTINKQGLLEPTRLNCAEIINQLRQELNREPTNDDWVVWGRWFLADPLTRTISPFSQQTVPQYIEDRITENTAESLDEAERLVGDDVRWSKRIAEARGTLEQTIGVQTLKNDADALVAQGKLAEAVALLAQACELNPKDTDASLTLATWQTWFGQEADYEATRRRLVQQAQGTDKAGAAERAAKACCIRPSTDTALLTNALNLAQRAVELGKNNSLLPWYQLGLGLAQYRNSQYAAAERSLTIAEQTVGEQNRDIQAIARLFRAMSLSRQNRQDEARKLFDQAESQMPPYPQDEQKPLADGKPVSHDYLICWLAYKEAKSVLNEPGRAKP
jgi:tetratricopeptide (TPR) repeat protein